MSADPIRIGIVDDHNLVRKALKNWLAQLYTFDVRIEAANGEELFDRLQKDSELDVLILDLHMPGQTGKDCLKQLHRQYPHIKVLIVSMSLDYPVVNELLDLGAYGYLSKGADISELSEAIKDASMRKVHRNKILTDALYWNKDNAIQQPRAFYKDQPSNKITEKEKKVLHLLWDEKSTQEIAEEVFLSISAVDKIKQQLKEKAGVKSTVGLIRYAIEKEIIIPEMKNSAPQRRKFG